MIYLYICTTSSIGIRLPSFCYVIFVPTIDRRIRPTKWLLSLWRQCLCEQNIHICPLPKNFFWPRMHTMITNHKYKLTLIFPLVFGQTGWHLLKSPLSAKISINRINALMSCLCKIHNFCIDNSNAKPPQCYKCDALMLMDCINDLDSEDPCLLGLLGGGKHFADIPEGRHGANQRSQRLAMQQSANDMISHNDMLEHVIYKRPTPSSTI